MIMVFTESLDGCNEIILYFNRLMNMLSKQKMKDTKDLRYIGLKYCREIFLEYTVNASFVRNEFYHNVNGLVSLSDHEYFRSLSILSR